MKRRIIDVVKDDMDNAVISIHVGANFTKIVCKKFHCIVKDIRDLPIIDFWMPLIKECRDCVHHSKTTRTGHHDGAWGKSSSVMTLANN